MKFPILTRYKQKGGRWSVQAHADTLEQARAHVGHYRRGGYTEIEIKDAEGQPLTDDELGGGK